jgi:hypothetical protein
MMSKKRWVIQILTHGMVYEACEAIVEADTKEEALALFHDDENMWEWDNWETVDSTVEGWETGDVIELTKEEEKLRY